MVSSPVFSSSTLKLQNFLPFLFSTISTAFLILNSGHFYWHHVAVNQQSVSAFPGLALLKLPDLVGRQEARLYCNTVAFKPSFRVCPENRIDVELNIVAVFKLLLRKQLV